MNAVIRKLLSIPWWLQVLLLCIASVIYIEIAGLIGTRLLATRIGWGAGVAAVGDNTELVDSIQGRFVRWDSGYYLQIAENGYRAGGTERAFFPLYPLLTYLLSRSLALSLPWTGFAIAITCFVTACMAMYQWILIDFQPRAARWSIVWICVFPMSFFFVAFYAESLYLLLCLACIYFARRGKFAASGICIALAGATRPLGILLVVPYVVEFWLQRNYSRTQWTKFGAGILIAPFGVLSYLLFLAFQAREANFLSLYSSNQTTEWGIFLSWPWLTLFDGINAAINGANINLDWFSRALAWHDLSYALLALLTAIWALIHLRLSVSSFLLTSVLFLFTRHGAYGYAFWSMGRYVAALFPLYLILALAMDKVPVRFRWLPVSISMGLLGVLAAWFASGRWVA